MSDNVKTLSKTGVFVRGCVLVAMGAATAGISLLAGFDPRHAFTCSIFIIIIFTTLLFWQYRLPISFVGIAALLAARILTLRSFVESCELDIILFLVGMMVVIGVLKDLGLFTWIIQSVLNTRRMTGMKFVLMLIFLSAFMACAVDEVTSIVIMCTLVFHVCDTLKIRPLPFLMISVMATNIGSSGTMLGNPVGILLGYKAGFTFVDFMMWSFPVMLLVLAVSAGVLCLWFRKEIALFNARMEERRTQQLGLSPLVRTPHRRALAILVGTLLLIACHHLIEQALGVQKNTFLIAIPLLVSGVLMIWRSDRARHYIENDVEWWTLLFFMMLFAVAGSLVHTGVTSRLAENFVRVFGSDVSVLTPLIILVSAVGSSIVDNIVLVAAFIPIVKELGDTPLWWALLFGACFGGNITMIGSTANIVALGLLEKRCRMQVSFMEWLKVGIVVGLVSCAVAWGALAVLGPHMPSEERRLTVHGSELSAAERPAMDADGARNR